MHRVLATLLLAALALTPLAAAPLTGRVVDADGQAVADAVVTLRSADGEEVTLTAADGAFAFPDLERGPVTVAVVHERLGQAHLQVDEGQNGVEAVLRPASHRDEITVTGTRIAADPAVIPGSVEVLDRRDLEGEHVLTTGEALRKVAGVNVRDEEGFGLRPNIGIRGLNPTRSSKVLLLEDGIPVTYAPYGDNASYYHPPVERFESIEVVKGSGQIAWGPSTIGGVINYLTPAPPSKPSVSATLVGGSDEFSDARLSTGGTFGRTGLTLDLMRKEGDGARENVHSLLNDINAKLVFTASPVHRFTLRGNWYTEDSMVTYSGLRQNEWEENPRANPFENDSFDGSRVGTSLSHDWRLAENRAVTTTLYASRFRRHWWRQSSNSAQRPNDASDPNCSGMANLNTTCGNEGRLREFVNWGLESRMAVRGRLLGLDAQTDLGVRAHFEDQERLQVNGDAPLARSGRIVEDNERQNDAYSAFVQTRLTRGAWSLSPGVRVEQVDYRRTNRLANGGSGVSGSTDLLEVIPGLGLAWNRGETTIFAGVHRGFAPPRTEDVISNSNGGVIELDPERSWNSELGVRSTVRSGLDVAATIFRMDYENQIVPASIAGGVGATLTNGGETTHQGVELSSRIDTAPLFGTAHNTYAKLAWTWVADAKYAGTRFSAIPGAGNVDVSGNRLPYAPEHLLTAGIGYLFPSGADAFIEAVHVGEQFADDLNTVTPTADGQRGLIDASTVLNASFNYPVASLDTTFFVAVKNVLDETYIVDRSRGILPGAPRQVQLGLTFRR